MITTGPPKLAVLGCGCSVATEPVAEISDFWNITHVRKCYTVHAYMLGPLSYLESALTLKFLPIMVARNVAWLYSWIIK